VEGPKYHQQLDSYQVIETGQTEMAGKVVVSGNERQVPQQVVNEIEVEKESLLNQAISGILQEGNDDVELDNDV
jgi:superfamily I DNA and/or RNA helicase